MIGSRTREMAQRVRLSVRSVATGIARTTFENRLACCGQASFWQCAFTLWYLGLHSSA